MTSIGEIKKQFNSDTVGNFNFEQIKNKYLGRKQGLITKAFQELVNLDMAAKRQLGPELNKLRMEIEQKLSAFSGGRNEHWDVDLTLPSLQKQFGHLHPLTQTQKQLEEIFAGLGFKIVTGKEIETDWYNFSALNFPAFHPARDMQDTFFIAGQENKPSREKILLRTHTSPMQVRFMEKHKPPFAIIVPGTVYRNEATDATHEFTIHQTEGLVVGEYVSFANMVWTIDHVFKQFFGSEIKLKILPTFFPFVEPGAEIAMSSPKFKNGKWIEMGGCGMVHQNVFEAAGYPKNKYQGFAFGMGSIRFPLMKNGITDIRLLHENNLQFLEQF